MQGGIAIWQFFAFETRLLLLVFSDVILFYFVGFFFNAEEHNVIFVCVPRYNRSPLQAGPVYLLSEKKSLLIFSWREMKWLQ